MLQAPSLCIGERMALAEVLEKQHSTQCVQQELRSKPSRRRKQSTTFSGQVSSQASEHCIKEEDRLEHESLQRSAAQGRNSPTGPLPAEGQPPGSRKRAGRPRASRYKGVITTGIKYQAYVDVNLTRYSLGAWPTEIEAARAVDEAHIYQKTGLVNLVSEEYDTDEIGKHANLRSFAKDKQMLAKQLQKATQRSKYHGVSNHRGSGQQRKKWSCHMRHEGKGISLGCYFTEEEAAAMYDQARIFKKLDPINRPDFPYNKEAICSRHASFAEFADQVCKDAEETTKARQHSRFTGVSWGANKWHAYVHLPSTRKKAKVVKKHLGVFLDEEAAARAVDAARIKQGQKAVNLL